MKPRTKLQFEVLKLAKQLPDIKPKIMDWAKSDILQHKAFSTTHRVICMDCGQKFKPELITDKKAICPHCHTALTVEITKNRTDNQHLYLAYADVFDDFQIVRYFELKSKHKADQKAEYSIIEILSHWILPNGKREVIARNHTLNYYCSAWNGYLEIRDKSKKTKYDVYHDAIHPDSEFQPMYKQIGIDENTGGITIFQAITHVPHYSKAETLLKTRQYDLLRHSLHYSGQINLYWPSIKMCIRNNYTVHDAQMWFDYLDLLAHFRKDLHNAHYVCPTDLKTAHDNLVDKKRLQQEKQNAIRKRQKAIEDEAEFKKLRAQFFGLVFQDELIHVKLLESVGEFMEEGDTMHHCVFTNEYYLKPDSLVFSAKIAGERVETVEVSLNQMKVVQSRGVRNKNTEYHDRIIELVNKNIDKINHHVAHAKKLNNGKKNRTQRVQNNHMGQKLQTRTA